jgi:predicted nucleic acid-binding protein
MKKNKVYLDVNIILEVLGKRKNYKFAKCIFENLDNQLLVSILTIHLVFYFAKKCEINLDKVKEIIDLCEIVEAGSKEYSLAQVFYAQNSDMEDAIQIAVAFSHGCDTFATLDKDMIKKFAGKVGFEFVTA